MNNEIWKDIEYHGVIYHISSYGNIKGIRNKLLKQRLNQDGYMVVTLGNGKYRTVEAIHRLVARAFIPKPNDKDKFEVNHKDCNRINNNVENLEWVTHKQNIEHAYKHNTMAQYVARDGIKNGRATFNDDDIIEIRRLYNEESLSIAEITRRFNSSDSTISSIVHNQTWKHLL